MNNRVSISLSNFPQELKKNIELVAMLEKRSFQQQIVYMCEQHLKTHHARFLSGTKALAESLQRSQKKD